MEGRDHGLFEGTPQDMKQEC